MFSGLRAEPRLVVHRIMFPDSSHEPVATDEIRRFAAQVAENPESLAFARLADAYRKAGALERALETVEQGLLRHPDYLSAHIVRGRTLRELGRRSAASAAFRRVLELDPQNLVALRALAELAVEDGNSDEARRLYERLQELEPLDERVRAALRGLDRSREEEGVERVAEERPGTGEEPQMATEGAEARADEEPGEGDSDRLDTSTMAELYLRQGLYEEAERVYARLLRFRPDDPEVRRKLERVRVLIRGERPDDEGLDVASVEEAEHASDASPESRAELPGPDHTIRRYLQRLMSGETPADQALDVPRPSAFDAWLERRGGGG